MLTREEIIEFMNKEVIKDRLIITPLFDLDELIDPVSIDVRLGNELIIMKKESFSALDIKKREELSTGTERYQENVRLNFREEFVLHPNQLIIGSTLVYSDALWPLIPIQGGHPFRSKMATCSDPLWPVIPIQSGHP